MYKYLRTPRHNVSIREINVTEVQSLEYIIKQVCMILVYNLTEIVVG